MLAYYAVLRSALRQKQKLRPCRTRCVDCGIFFITHPRNAERHDLRCPFGCREAHSRERSTERSVAYNRSPTGKLKKKGQNKKRRKDGVADDRNIRSDDTRQAEAAEQSTAESPLGASLEPEPAQRGGVRDRNSTSCARATQVAGVAGDRHIRSDDARRAEAAKQPPSKEILLRTSLEAGNSTSVAQATQPSAESPLGASLEPEPAQRGGVRDASTTSVAAAVVGAAGDRHIRSAGDESPEAIAVQTRGSREEFQPTIVSYLQTTTSLLEGRKVSRDEILEMLRQVVRQHSIARQGRIDYVVEHLNKRPP